MAAKKKSKAKKKTSGKNTTKKSVSAKKSVTAKSAKVTKKTSSKKKKTNPGKSVANKDGATQDVVQKNRNLSGRESASKTTETVVTATAEKKKMVKQKLSTGNSKKIGLKVKPLTGRKSGEKGVIVRQDASLGTFFITFDNLQNDSIYKNTEWGPYFESQLEFIKNR